MKFKPYSQCQSCGQQYNMCRCAAPTIKKNFWHTCGGCGRSDCDECNGS